VNGVTNFRGHPVYINEVPVNTMHYGRSGSLRNWNEFSNKITQYPLCWNLNVVTRYL